MIRQHPLYSIVLSAVAVCGCAHQNGLSDTVTLNRAESAMLAAINEYRAERNLPQLVADSRLCAAAEEHNRLMRDRIRILGLQAGTTHWGQLGRRIRDAGYEYSYAAENVAAGR